MLKPLDLKASSAACSGLEDDLAMREFLQRKERFICPRDKTRFACTAKLWYNCSGLLTAVPAAAGQETGRKQGNLASSR